jgi:hypothetical protein
MLTFQYNGLLDIRYKAVGEEIVFVAADVCNALGIGNTSQAVKRLDQDEKGIYPIDTLKGKQRLLCVNEPGLYTLILSSDKPEAKQFKRWITHDVIPEIRRSGKYSTPEYRLTQFSKTTQIPPGYWCVYVMTVTYSMTGNEFLIDDAMPGGVIGKEWFKYLKTTSYNMKNVKRFPHTFPDSKTQKVDNIYPNDCLGLFWSWLQIDYLAKQKKIAH